MYLRVWVRRSQYRLKASEKSARVPNSSSAAGVAEMGSAVTGATVGWGISVDSEVRTGAMVAISVMATVGEAVSIYVLAAVGSGVSPEDDIMPRNNTIRYAHTGNFQMRLQSNLRIFANMIDFLSGA